MKVYITHKRDKIITLNTVRDKITEIELDIDDNLYSALKKDSGYRKFKYIDNKIVSIELQIDDSLEGFRTLVPEPFTLQKQMEDNLKVIPVYKYKAVVIQYPLEHTNNFSDKSVTLKIDDKEYPLIFDEFDQGVFTITHKELTKRSKIEIENKINNVYFCPNHPCDINFIDLNKEDEIDESYVEVPVIDGFLQIPMEFQETIGYLINKDNPDEILDYFIIEEKLELPPEGILVINGTKIKPVLIDA